MAKRVFVKDSGGQLWEIDDTDLQGALKRGYTQTTPQAEISAEDAVMKQAELARQEQSGILGTLGTYGQHFLQGVGEMAYGPEGNRLVREETNMLLARMGLVDPRINQKIDRQLDPQYDQGALDTLAKGIARTAGGTAQILGPTLYGQGALNALLPKAATAPALPASLSAEAELAASPSAVDQFRAAASKGIMGAAEAAPQAARSTANKFADAAIEFARNTTIGSLQGLSGGVETKSSEYDDNLLNIKLNFGRTIKQNLIYGGAITGGLMGGGAALNRMKNSWLTGGKTGELAKMIKAQEEKIAAMQQLRPQSVHEEAAMLDQLQGRQGARVPPPTVEQKFQQLELEQSSNAVIQEQAKLAELKDIHENMAIRNVALLAGAAGSVGLVVSGGMQAGAATGILTAMGAGTAFKNKLVGATKSKASRFAAEFGEKVTMDAARGMPVIDAAEKNILDNIATQRPGPDASRKELQNFEKRAAAVKKNFTNLRHEVRSGGIDSAIREADSYSGDMQSLIDKEVYATTPIQEKLAAAELELDNLNVAAKSMADRDAGKTLENIQKIVDELKQPNEAAEQAAAKIKQEIMSFRSNIDPALAPQIVADARAIYNESRGNKSIREIFTDASRKQMGAIGSVEGEIAKFEAELDKRMMAMESTRNDYDGAKQSLAYDMFANRNNLVRQIDTLIEREKSALSKGQGKSSKLAELERLKTDTEEVLFTLPWKDPVLQKFDEALDPKAKYNKQFKSIGSDQMQGQPDMAGVEEVMNLARRAHDIVENRKGQIFPEDKANSAWKSVASRYKGVSNIETGVASRAGKAEGLRNIEARIKEITGNLDKLTQQKAQMEKDLFEALQYDFRILPQKVAARTMPTTASPEFVAALQRITDVAAKSSVDVPKGAMDSVFSAIRDFVDATTKSGSKGKVKEQGGTSFETATLKRVKQIKEKQAEINKLKADLESRQKTIRNLNSGREEWLDLSYKLRDMQSSTLPELQHGFGESLAGMAKRGVQNMLYTMNRYRVPGRMSGTDEMMISLAESLGIIDPESLNEKAMAPSEGDSQKDAAAATYAKATAAAAQKVQQTIGPVQSDKLRGTQKGREIAKRMRVLLTPQFVYGKVLNGSLTPVEYRALQEYYPELAIDLTMQVKEARAEMEIRGKKFSPGVDAVIKSILNANELKKDTTFYQMLHAASKENTSKSGRKPPRMSSIEKGEQQ